MKRVVDLEEVKWWDALDAFGAPFYSCKDALRLARLSRHPDAVWLCSLFPPGASLVREDMKRVLEALGGDDPRVMFLVSYLEPLSVRRDSELALLRRAAELGYAPAQALLSVCCRSEDERMAWAEAAASQGDRNGSV
jgi:hypothetical protein